jgi:hypothetical protein
MPNSSETTKILLDAASGDRSAVDQLMPLVYDELRGLAELFMAQERADHTLQATALVNEAYLRLIDQTRVDWQGRAHFCAVAWRWCMARSERKSAIMRDLPHVPEELSACLP